MDDLAPQQHAARIARLGFPVKVMAREDLKSNDSRRAPSHPHLKVSTGYLERTFDHLERHDIIAPYAPHPDMPQLHGMVRESAAELRALSAARRAADAERLEAEEAAAIDEEPVAGGA